MYVIKARKGSFSFSLTSLGWQCDRRIGNMPPCRMDFWQALKVCADQRDKHDFDLVYIGREGE
jgi:hypothetical protein